MVGRGGAAWNNLSSGACDVVLLPSMRGASPSRCWKPWLRGKPIVVMSIGRHRELASQAVMARLVPLADPAALAEAIQQFARDPALMAHLAAGARHLFESRYTEDRIQVQAFS